MRLIFVLWLLLSSALGFASPKDIQFATRFEHLSLEDGLSQISIFTMLQDSKGFLWFGTRDGLNRYDGYSFKVFRHDPLNPNTISDNYIRTLFIDSKGRLWIGTYSGGLNLFDAQTEQFIHFSHDPTNPRSLSHNSVSSIHEDTKGSLWVGTRGGGLNQLEATSGGFKHYKHIDGNPSSLSDNYVYAIVEDTVGDLWLGTRGGLNHFDISRQTFSHYKHKQADPNSISHNRVYAIHETHEGNLWLGTPNGISLFDVKTQQVKRFTHQENNPHSLSHDSVTSFFEDTKGSLLIGTYGGGLNRYSVKHNRFVHFKHDADDDASLSHNVVRSIFKDNQGALWVGTQGGGINKLDNQKTRFGYIKGNVSNSPSLGNNFVRSIYIDSENTLWIGTEDGLNQFNAKTQQFAPVNIHAKNELQSTADRIMAIVQDAQGTLWLGNGTVHGGLKSYHPKTKKVTRFNHQSNNPNSLSDDNISTLFIDSHNNLWIGTNSGGLDLYQPKTNSFIHFQHDESDPHSLSDNTIRALYEDSNGTLWIGTDGGLNRFDALTKRFESFQHQVSNPASLSHNRVSSIVEDAQGTLWVGTFGSGLNRFDSKTNIFTHYREVDGISSDAVHSLLEDDQRRLWIGTNKGLSRFNPTTQKFKNYNANDGLQSNEFNHGAYFKNNEGELFFGGINGFNWFHPNNIQDDLLTPDVVLTDFLLANQSVPIKTLADKNQYPLFTLPKSIDALSQLVLSYQQNLITFEFTALHFSNPQKNKFAYRLQGQDKDWIYTDAKNRRATYTNLSAGDYTLQIKASNHHGYWNEQGKSLKITVTPAPWKTWWAYSIYALCFISLMWAFAHGQHKKVLYQETLNQRLKQVDKLKDEFLANTSHELRTPLNGIIGLAESLIDGVAGPQSKSGINNLSMIVSSGRRLSNLINDVLDFSKLKNRNLTLHTNPVDLYTMVEVVLTLSRTLVAHKNLELVNDIPIDLPSAQADENRLQQILHNLVGNAIKFTESGKVTVTAKQIQNTLTISVTDTGIGIDKKHFATLFDSFEQIEGHAQRAYSGTGLGLSVSKQLVELHGGRLSVDSKLGQGSIFSFTLPVSAQKESIDAGVGNDSGYEQQVARLHLLNENLDVLESVTTTPIEPKAYLGPNQCRILVVDDEPVNRQVLHNHLSMQNYQLVEAAGGEEALKAITEDGPFDLILLDVMMPKISGYEVCAELRKTYALNDLPIIFLTAKNQVADMIESFAVGANDYLSKPISKHELLTRVETHLKFLDIHRNLESKVAERTAALSSKNKEISTKNKEIIETQQQLVQSEKMASLGTLTAGVAHQINNPNNYVQLSSQILAADLTDVQQFFIDLAGDKADANLLASFAQQFEPLSHHLNTIIEGSNRIKTIVEDLRTFTQLDHDEQKAVIVTDLLKATVSLVQAQYQQTIDFSLIFEDMPKLYCYPARLNQVFMHIIVNACHAIDAHPDKQQKGKITIGCRQKSQLIEISIKDNGIGMTEETKRKLFEPFYTTKEIGEGAGLGLSISFGIINKHGGTLTVESEVGVGTTFLIELPNTSVG